MSQVYRVKYGIALSENAGSGDWRYYEDQDDLEADLLNAYFDMRSRGPHGRVTKANRFCRAWRTFIKGTEKEYPRVDALYEVAVLVDGEWLPVEVEFREPAVMCAVKEVQS